MLTDIDEATVVDFTSDLIDGSAVRAWEEMDTASAHSRCG
jgi:hypothetical protein